MRKKISSPHHEICRFIILRRVRQYLIKRFCPGKIRKKRTMSQCLLGNFASLLFLSRFFLLAVFGWKTAARSAVDASSLPATRDINDEQNFRSILQRWVFSLPLLFLFFLSSHFISAAVPFVADPLPPLPPIGSQRVRLHPGFCALDMQG